MKIRYIAEDGREFQTGEECLRYEEAKRTARKRELGCEYFSILCKINHIKQEDYGNDTFKVLDRDLAKARDAYRIAKKNGIAGSKSYRFEKLTELRYNYVYAKNALKKAREEYNEKRKDLEKLGVLLGFRKSILRAQKEKQLKGDEK